MVHDDWSLMLITLLVMGSKANASMKESKVGMRHMAEKTYGFWWLWANQGVKGKKISFWLLSELFSQLFWGKTGVAGLGCCFIWFWVKQVEHAFECYFTEPASKSAVLLGFPCDRRQKPGVAGKIWTGQSLGGHVPWSPSMHHAPCYCSTLV